MSQSPTTSVESRQSWIVALASLVILSFGFGGGWITAVALTQIADEVGGMRSVPALALSLVWIGSGIGGIVMGRVADRIGPRWTVIGGTVMMAIGLAISTLGPTLPLYIGHGLFMGLIGMAGINAPLYVYVSRWFDRRRGSALALISSGAHVAGALWPTIFERMIAGGGWRQTMLLYAALQLAVVIPLAIIFLKAAPQDPPPPAALTSAASGKAQVLGLPPNLVFAMLMAGIFTCCIPMAMPQSHLVAFCTDLGINASHGAIMLSVLLGAAFVSRQVWGMIADRIGGLKTVLIGSGAQAIGMVFFIITQDEVGLFVVAAAFGLGFSGLIPASVLAARELFPASEASWRLPLMLLCSATGMATGGWLAGRIYDHFGYYAPAFTAGIAVNLLNFALIAFLVARQRRLAREI